MTTEIAPAPETRNPVVGPFSPPLARKVALDFATPVGNDWMGGSYPASLLLNAYTLVFPALESIMIKELSLAAREHPDKVDPAIIRGFVQQEGAHAREHRHSFESVRAQGFEIDKLQRRIDAIVTKYVYGMMQDKILRPYFGDAFSVGIFAGAEHWTAALSEASLSGATDYVTVGRLEEAETPKRLSDMELLYLWHCAEEIEHKSVVADVFASLGGGELGRRMSFMMATPVFLALTGTAFVALLKQSKRVLGPDLWQMIGGWPGLMKDCRVQLKAMPGIHVRAIQEYLKSGFHPSQHETDHLVQQALTRLQELREVHAV